MDPLSALFGGGLGLASSSSASTSSDVSLSSPFINDGNFYLGVGSAETAGGEVGESNPVASSSTTASSAATATVPTTTQPAGTTAATAATVQNWALWLGIAASAVALLAFFKQK